MGEVPHDPNGSVRDWRLDGTVNPQVKNQGGCSCCYAFSITGAVEAAMHRAFGNDVDLSEQQIVDCSSSYGNAGCHWGFTDKTLDYIIKSGGLDVEDAYPYTGTDGTTCRFQANAVGATVKSYNRLPSGDENQLKSVVGTIGPVSVLFAVSDDYFRFYDSGVYSSDECGKHATNHAFIVIGYGVENWVPYWIIKNQWGSAWGEDGYARILMGSNMCGIANAPLVPVVQ